MSACRPQPREHAPEPLYFASGASRTPDLRGFARAGHPFGVAVPDLADDGIAALERLGGAGVPIFVDTGAFSEVTFGPDGPTVVAPIDDDAWAEIVAVMLRLARALAPDAYLVAPDRVGDQAETLRRLRRWASEMREARAVGARVVVPIQLGALPPAEFDRACAAALGFDDFVRGVPGNKAAMPPHVLAPYLAATRPAAVHLLGVGLRGRFLPELLAALRAHVPNCAVSCDSNLLAAHVGRSNGACGGPRLLTAMTDTMAQIVGAEAARESAVRGMSLLLTAARAGLLGAFGMARETPGRRTCELDGHGQGVVFETPGLRRPVQLGLFDEVRSS